MFLSRASPAEDDVVGGGGGGGGGGWALARMRGPRGRWRRTHLHKSDEEPSAVSQPRLKAPPAAEEVPKGAK